MVSRVIGAIERRLEEPLNLKPADLAGLSWQELTDQVNGAVESLYQLRFNRLLGEKGAIQRDLDAWLETYGQESLGEAREDAPTHLAALLADRVLTLSHIENERLAKVIAATMTAGGQTIQVEID